MAMVVPSICFALQHEMLHQAGFKVKNTFIDELEQAQDSQSDAILRRAVTAPLPRQQFWEIDASDSETEGGRLEGAAKSADVDQATEASTAAPIDSDFTDSMTLPLFARMHSESSFASAPAPASVDAIEEPKLASLIRQECGFLRIVSCAVVSLDPLRNNLKGVSRCLRVCVSGLPTQKRMKWQSALSWSVAAVLQRAGCPVTVKRGNLLAPLDVDAGSELIRVDLCAPRLFDDEE